MKKFIVALALIFGTSVFAGTAKHDTAMVEKALQEGLDEYNLILQYVRYLEDTDMKNKEKRQLYIETKADANKSFRKFKNAIKDHPNYGADSAVTRTQLNAEIMSMQDVYSYALIKISNGIINCKKGNPDC